MLHAIPCSLVAFSLAADPADPPPLPVPVVLAAAQTEPVKDQRDAADDAAVWVRRDDPARSLVVTTNKRRGLMVHDLDGRLVQELPDGRVNNVDVLHDVATGQAGGRADLVLASNRTSNTVSAYAVDRASGRLSLLPGAPFPAGGPEEVYGLCAYADPRDGGARVVVVSKCGRVRVLALRAADSGESWQSEVVRDFHVGSQAEGCAADPSHGWLYIGEESVGVWRYPLDPESDAPRELLDTVWPRLGGRLARDVEGVTIYGREDGSGWVIVSCQGQSRFAAYDRVTGAYAGSFAVALPRADGTTDRVTHTDGIDAVSAALGPRFPCGVFIAQDDNDGLHQNFKIVDWREIERVLRAPDAASAADAGDR